MHSMQDVLLRRRALGISSLAAASYAVSSRKASAQTVDWKTVSLSDFGAKGDGITDDAPAINRAVDFLRAQRLKVPGRAPGFKLTLNGGIYLLKSTIDLTRIRNFGVLLQGSGATLLAATDGKPAIDALSSRWLHFEDIYILGDPAQPPNIGIQIGRSGAEHGDPSDNHIFENVALNGFFSQSCIYNFGSETTVFFHCFAWNKHPSLSAYSLIQDGNNSFRATSPFVEALAAANVAVSFNENLFVNCDFRRTGSGPAMWLASTSRHRFERCYAVTNGPVACVINLAGQGHALLDMDCHFEGPNVTHVFLFEGADKAIVRGFRYTDHTSPPQMAVFQAGEGTHDLSIENADITIASFTHQNIRIFDRPEVWQVSGSYYSAHADPWNMPRRFSGLVTLGLATTFHGTLIPPG